MRQKVEKRKITFSITLDAEVLRIINNTITNRSKFIENIIIDELCKSSNIKEDLKNNNII